MSYDDEDGVPGLLIVIMVVIVVLGLAQCFMPTVMR